MSVPADLEKKWRAKLAAFRRAAKSVADGDTSIDGVLKMARARDALDTMLWEISGYESSSSPAWKHRQAERDALVTSLWESSKEAGRKVIENARSTEMKHLDAEIRKANEPYEWMNRKR